MSPVVEHLSIAELAVGPDKALPGFDFPAPRHPAYLRQERTEDVEALLPLARSLVRRKYGRAALDVAPEDEILIITAPHQNPVVFEVMGRALREIGAKRVDQVSTADLGLPVQEYSAAEGWREITDRLRPMVEEGVEFSVAASALQRHLDDRPGYTAVFAGEAGRRHWKRVASGRMRNNWLFSTYEDLI